MHDLEHRAGLPDALRVLLRDYPRDIWESHRNFDTLTRFWLDRHLMFRDVVARIRSETEAFLDRRSDPRAYGARSARLTGLLLSELHGHHQIEDLQYFPVLSGLDRRLAAGFDLLDGDHHALDAHLHALAGDTNATLQALQSDGQAARAAAGTLHARLERFAGFLDRHLIDEEELVIPVILHHAPRF